MMGANTEAEKEAVMTVSLHTSKPFKMAKVMDQLVELRSDALDYHDKIEVSGRKRLYSLIAGVYEIYHAAKIEDKIALLQDKVVEKLRELPDPKDPKVKYEPSKNADISSLLIRFVFAADDKQISIWAKALRVNYKGGVAPSQFIDSVEEQTGGIGGFSEKKEPKTPKITVDTAVEVVRKSKNVTEIEEFTWHDGEVYRLLIAVRGEDDEADIKELALSKDQREAVLVKYQREQEVAKKLADAKAKAANKLHPDKQLAIDEAVAKKAIATVALGTAEKALRDAKAMSPDGKHAKLVKAVESAQATVKVADLELKAARKA